MDGAVHALVMKFAYSTLRNGGIVHFRSQDLKCGAIPLNVSLLGTAV